MVKNNKAIMSEIVEVVKSQFNVQARANLENYGEITINLNVVNVPESVIKKIQTWVNAQGFQIPTYINTVVTASYEQRIHAKCAEMGKVSIPRQNATTCIAEQSYLRLDMCEAHELIWNSDMGTSTNKIVIVPGYKVKAELQYA